MNLNTLRTIAPDSFLRNPRGTNYTAQSSNDFALIEFQHAHAYNGRSLIKPTLAHEMNNILKCKMETQRYTNPNDLVIDDYQVAYAFAMYQYTGNKTRYFLADPIDQGANSCILDLFRFLEISSNSPFYKLEDFVEHLDQVNVLVNGPKGLLPLHSYMSIEPRVYKETLPTILLQFRFGLNGHAYLVSKSP